YFSLHDALPIFIRCHGPFFSYKDLSKDRSWQYTKLGNLIMYRINSGIFTIFKATTVINRQIMIKTISRLAVLSLLVTGISLSSRGQDSLTPRTAATVVEDGGTGPYSAVMLTEESLPTHTVFRPENLSVFDDSRRLPVIAWGNGACANSPWEHVNFLSEVSSHGFLVIALGPIPLNG